MKQTTTEDPASDASGFREGRDTSELVGDGEVKQSMATVTRLSNAYWGSWIKGYKEAAAALGYRTNVQLHHGKPEKQLQQIKASIANGVDIITGQAFTNADSPPIAKAAVDAGVPLVLCWTIAEWFTPQDAGEEFVQYFMPNAVNNGYAAAKALFEAMDGSGRIVQIEGIRGHAANRGRTAGLEKALAEYPDIERLAPPQQGRWVRSEARNVMADYVSQFGSAIDGVFGQNDDMALGALTVAEEHDIDIGVVGIDGTPEVLQLIDEGTFTASVSALGPWQGGWSVVKAHDFANGWRPDPAERMLFHDNPLLVREPQEFEMIETVPVLEAGAFNAKIFEGESTPYDWERMSVVETGDDWDPQTSLVPIRKADLTEQGLFNWSEETRPEGYELPSVYSDTAALDAVEHRYASQFQHNPLAGDE